MLSVIFVLVIVLRLLAPWRRIQFVAAALVLFFALSLPFSARFPGSIVHSMLRYQGTSGIWGVPAISFITGAERVSHLYQQYGKVILVGALICASFVVRRTSMPLFTQCVLIAFVSL